MNNTTSHKLNTTNYIPNNDFLHMIKNIDTSKIDNNEIQKRLGWTGKDECRITKHKEKHPIMRPFLNTIKDPPSELEYKAIIDKINNFELRMRVLSKERMAQLQNDELKKKTACFKERIEQLQNEGKSEKEALDTILPEAFAVVREAARRVLDGKRAFEVQLVGGIVLHEGKIAEMKTGEGKTLTALAPAYLNALTGKGVHIVTVNPYLAERDASEMGKVFEFLGLSVGVVTEFKSDKEKQEAYQKDITYVVDQDLAFDYLRDNIEQDPAKLRQREPNFLILDEIDQILIDENSTPLILSTPDNNASNEEEEKTLLAVASVIKELKAQKIPDIKKFRDDKGPKWDPTADYCVDDKGVIDIYPKGWRKIEKHLSLMLKQPVCLYENQKAEDQNRFMPFIWQCLKAKELFKLGEQFLFGKDKDNKNGKEVVQIIMENTGRVGEGRKWTDGLHEAVSAICKVNGFDIQLPKPNKTVASITYPNFIKRYPKFAGMSGTAKSSEQEFQELYGLNVIQVPTNKPYIREDLPDMAFKTKSEKRIAVVEAIKERTRQGCPILVFTSSVNENKELSKLLNEAKIPHNRLDCMSVKANTSEEADIIKQAGKLGSVTIATNMAGRGVDIMLGGNPSDPKEQEEVIKNGGLFILCTEHFAAQRTDDQALGRTARQGKPGSIQFFVSLEDELYVKHGGEKIQELKEKFASYPAGKPLPQDTALILKEVQKQVEADSYKNRKDQNKFDEALNLIRNEVYKTRKDILTGKIDAVKLMDYYLDFEIKKKTDDIFSSEKLSSNYYPLPRILNKKESIALAQADEWVETLIEKELLPESSNILNLTEESKIKKISLKTLANLLQEKIMSYTKKDKKEVQSNFFSWIRNETNANFIDKDKKVIEKSNHSDFKIIFMKHNKISKKEFKNLLLADHVINILQDLGYLPHLSQEMFRFYEILKKSTPKDFSQKELINSIKKEVVEGHNLLHDNDYKKARAEAFKEAEYLHAIIGGGNETMPISEKLVSEECSSVANGQYERDAILTAIDAIWSDFLSRIEEIKDGAKMQRFVEKNPEDVFREWLAKDYLTFNEQTIQASARYYFRHH